MWEDRVAVHVGREFLDMLKSQNVAKQFVEFLVTDLVNAVYMDCFLDLMPSLKKLFVSCHYYLFIICLALMLLKVNTPGI